MESSSSSSSSSSSNNYLYSNVKHDQDTLEKEGSVTLPVSVLRSLECSLCLTTICEPISISCGHSFCRVCLVNSLRRHKKRCPTCREVCHITAENAAENIMIKSLAIAVDPDGYAARVAEALPEKESWTNLYPIFYYNNTMFPGGRLNLHLFEPRYKLMMQRIVDSTRAFAYVPNFNTYLAQVGDVALVAELKDAEFLADGRCFLDAVLAKRKRIVEHYIESGTQGLHFCRLGPYDDEPIPESMLETAVRLKSEGIRYANIIMESSPNNRHTIEGQYGSMPTDTETFSLWLTALSNIPDKGQYQLLLCRDTVHRLQKCVDNLTPIVQRIEGRSAQPARSVAGTLNNAFREMTTFLHMAAGIGHTSDDGEEEDANQPPPPPLEPLAAALPQQQQQRRQRPRQQQEGRQQQQGDGDSDTPPPLVSDSSSDSDDSDDREEIELDHMDDDDEDDNEVEEDDEDGDEDGYSEDDVQHMPNYMTMDEGGDYDDHDQPSEIDPHEPYDHFDHGDDGSVVHDDDDSVYDQ